MTTSSTCTKENLIVETEKGKYTMPTDDWVFSACEAQKRCTKLGGSILAPIKEQSEFKAVMNGIKSCDHQDPIGARYIGLYIADDNSTRVFSDGEKFDYGVHGDLYQEHHVSPQNCPSAILLPNQPDKLHIGVNWWCGEKERLFICFEPKKTIKSDAITSGSEGESTSLLIAVGSFLLVALVCLVFYVVRQNKNLRLKLQQTSNDV